MKYPPSLYELREGRPPCVGGSLGLGVFLEVGPHEVIRDVGAGGEVLALVTAKDVLLADLRPVAVQEGAVRRVGGGHGGGQAGVGFRGGCRRFGLGCSHWVDFCLVRDEDCLGLIRHTLREDGRSYGHAQDQDEGHRT